jgi:hypothetical protein
MHWSRGRPAHKDVKNEATSGDVHENKDEADKMYVYQRDFFAENARILRNSG